MKEMATVSKNNLEDTKQSILSPKLKNRENTKDTQCRNVTIYGKCRFEDKGCAFNHKLDKPVMADVPSNGNQDGQSKRSLNVDSPSFTPSFLSPVDNGKKAGGTTISPKAASAAPFMPKQIMQRQINNATPPVRQDARTPDWTMAEVQEFIPRRLEASLSSSQSSDNHEISTPPAFDTFQPTHHQNPYIDSSLNGAAYYQGPAGYQQPPQYHNYAPIGPYSTNLASYQRTVHELFLANDIREDVQKKMAAALQILPNSQLPAHIESYHSLVPLDTAHRKGSGVFGGYTSWVYKAQNSQNGHFFALRRIEGFRLTSELAIRSVQNWKHVSSGSVVRIVDAFTNRGFGDSSLFIVTDYHPLSKTLAEHHHIGQSRNVRNNRGSMDHVPEAVLWSYMTQIASAIRIIHNSGLAARVIDTTKILVTGKHRVRLNGCAVLDVIQHDEQKPLAQLQRQDLVNFGLVMLSLGANMSDAAQNFARGIDQFKRFYKPELQNAVIWLYSAMANQERTIDQFITLISSQMITAFDSSLQADDSMYKDLAREVENGRAFRLMAKLGTINERPEFEHDRQWSENGERYFLKLFRDYVFHQVDAQNHPVVDLAHILTCMSKLDAGIDEKITLISRDEATCFVVSYRELKKALESAFQDLVRKGRHT